MLAIEQDAKVDILHACGGNARCTTCRVEFIEGEPATLHRGGKAAARRARPDRRPAVVPDPLRSRHDGPRHQPSRRFRPSGSRGRHRSRRSRRRQNGCEPGLTNGRCQKGDDRQLKADLPTADHQLSLPISATRRAPVFQRPRRDAIGKVGRDLGQALPQGTRLRRESELTERGHDAREPQVIVIAGRQPHPGAPVKRSGSNDLQRPRRSGLPRGRRSEASRAASAPDVRAARRRSANAAMLIGPRIGAAGLAPLRTDSGNIHWM